MVINDIFNGINLPSIYICDKNQNIKLVREFGYDDFKSQFS